MPSRFTKLELCDIVRIDPDIMVYGLSSKEVASIIDRYLDTMKNEIVSLAPGERIELREFGTFFVRQSKPRLARNPKTGEQVQVDARKRVAFKPGSEMKERVKG